MRAELGLDASTFDHARKTYRGEAQSDAGTNGKLELLLAAQATQAYFVAPDRMRARLALQTCRISELAYLLPVGVGHRSSWRRDDHTD